MPNDGKVYHVFSHQDSMTKITSGNDKVMRGAINIELLNMKHPDFNFNEVITYNGAHINLYDLYEMMLRRAIHREQYYTDNPKAA